MNTNLSLLVEDTDSGLFPLAIQEGMIPACPTQQELQLEDSESEQDMSSLFVLSQGQFVPASDEQILSSAREVAKRKVPEGEGFTSPLAVREYIEAQLMGRDVEVFAAMFLNTQNKLLSFKILFTGTVNQANVYPRELLKEALKCHASAVIIAHNHPGGSIEPSRADLMITEQLEKSLELIDIRLLDHILVAGAQSISFAEKGHM